MKIASWNVNSIRARLLRVLPWLSENAPDVLCLQETKVEDALFPREDIERLGYRIALLGQKTYNGVAILVRGDEPTQITCGFDDGVADEQARFIAATVRGVRIASLYVPNGQAVGSDKFAYKLAWLRRCRAWLCAHGQVAEPLVLCGDFNVAPEDRDVHDPAEWKDQVLCHPDERAGFAALLDWGLQDVVRRHRPEAGLFTWWDYRQLSFPRNRGLRIDHILATPTMAERSRDASIDRNARKGKEASDHAPVLATFDV